jgi:hypothetical protein
MSRYISENQRSFVRKRAKYHCEYCLIHEDDTFFTCQIDHIISLKHGGNDDNVNLAYSCIFCNRNKGSDLGSVLLPDTTLIRFFNPRIDDWSEHFYLDDAVIEAKTDVGKVTIKILELNNVERILERLELQEVGRYPLHLD